MKIQLFIRELVGALTADTVRRIQDNFQRLQDKLSADILTSGQWRLMELTFSEDATQRGIPHNLGFVPLDVIETSIKGTGTLTYNFGLFTEQDVVVTVGSTNPADPLVVRFLVGRL